MLRRVPCATDLSTRSQRASLAAAGATGSVANLLTAEASAGAWRLVEVWSAGPVDVELAWSSGSGQGAHATVTLARGGRVCVFARTLSVTVTNRSSAPQTVGVNVADTEAFVDTRNVLSTEGTTVALMGGDVTSAEVPAFARTLLVPDRWTAGSPLLQLFDGAGNLMFQRLLSLLSDQPLELGDAASAVITWNGPAQAHRFTFGLAL